MKIKISAEEMSDEKVALGRKKKVLPCSLVLLVGLCVFASFLIFA